MLDIIRANIKNDNNNNIDRPIYGVYFICCIGNYLEVIEEQLKLLYDSGLYHKTKKLLCFICNYDSKDKKLHELFNKFYGRTEFFSTNKNLYEKFAINSYRNKILDEKYYVYYFHTKGVSKEHNSHFQVRRKILNFYTITKYEISLKLLKYYDVVGVTLLKYPKKHFSGNFWWSKSEHVKLLSNVNDKYLAPEMYICSNNYSKYIALSADGQVFDNSNLFNHIFLTDNQIIDNLIETEIDNLWGLTVIDLC
jgi:hypothetical protein